LVGSRQIYSSNKKGALFMAHTVVERQTYGNIPCHECRAQEWKHIDWDLDDRPTPPGTRNSARLLHGLFNAQNNSLSTKI